MEENYYMNQAGKNKYRVLIVDDAPMNRAALKRIFEDTYDVAEASNGQEALQLLKEYYYEIDIIILDLLMPVMDGKEFLKIKKSDSNIESIPTVVITSVESVDEQVELLELGANDYIHKPFYNSIIKVRVENVLQASLRYRQVVKAYSEAVEIAQTDPLSGLYNRATTQRMIENILQFEVTHTHALFMIDIDDFKSINDSYGHVNGDKVIYEIAQILKSNFDENEIIGRMGGDEFVVFVPQVYRHGEVLQLGTKLCESLAARAVQGMRIRCSVGVAVSPKDGTDFMKLYKNADKALYMAKSLGKGRCCIYRNEI